MTEEPIFRVLLAVWLLLPLPIFLVLLKIPAPYGRHRRQGWGPEIPARLGWVLMESPAPLLFFALFVVGDRPLTWGSALLLILWETHYLYRAFVYPFLGRNGGTIPASVAAMALCFNLVNAYLNGRWLFHFRATSAPLPVLGLGLVLFLAGFFTHVWADHKLRGLRRQGHDRYQIPRGRLFRHVSCPNYLGELSQWVGWAVLTLSLPGVAFAFWTAANLVPRALTHHCWYHREFPDYPAQRKALIPFII